MLLLDEIPQVTELEDQVLKYMNPNVAADRMSAQWPLSRMQDAALLGGGYLVCTVLGALFMKLFISGTGDKNPFDRLARLIQPLYNIVQVFLCAYMTARAAEAAYRQGYSVICNPFEPRGSEVTYILQVFYVSKALDFCDTAFIIMKKSWRQLSFLHVYHHFTIFVIYWMNSQAGYDGDVYYTIVLNSFVHFVMYFYYFLSPWFKAASYTPWWKFLITQLQLVQFFAMNGQALYLLFNGCAYPERMTWAYLIYIDTLIILFGWFSYVNYCKKKPRKDKRA